MPSDIVYSCEDQSIDIQKMVETKLALLSRPPSSPKTDRSLMVRVESVQRTTFETGERANDFAGSASLIVMETRKSPFGLRTAYFTKRFSYFIENCKEVALRELNPAEPLDPLNGLTTIPPVSTLIFGKAPVYTPPTLLSVITGQEVEAERSPIRIDVRDINNKPGNEVEIMGEKGRKVFGNAVNIKTKIYSN